MEKVVRNGMVAVIYSKYGHWYSSHENKELVFHPKIVELIENNTLDEVINKYEEHWVKEITDIECFTCVNELSVQWVPLDDKFDILLYSDYSSETEYILTENDLPFIA